MITAKRWLLFVVLRIIYYLINLKNILNNKYQIMQYLTRGEIMRDRWTTKLLIAVFLIVGLVPIVGALEATPTTIVAASDSSAADKAAAAYV